ncbi:MAG: DUF4386 domain-containing protein [Bacteroidota bacterium]|jgi:hypothetical protein
MRTKLFTLTSATLFLVLIFLSACTIQKRRYYSGYHVEFLKKNHWGEWDKKKHQEPERAVDSEKKDTLIPVTTPVNQLKKEPCKIETKDTLIKRSNLLPVDTVRFQKHSGDSIRKTEKAKKKDPTDKETENKFSNRKWAIILGLSILLMALTAGFAVPALGGLFVLGNTALTGALVTANFGRFVAAIAGWGTILLLDVLIGCGVIKYYKKEKPKISAVAGLLRILYSLVLAVGIANLIKAALASSAASIYSGIAAFNLFWGLGLIVFGFHLIALGITYQNEGGKKWVTIAIKSLLILAGVGYIVQYVGVLIVVNPVVFSAAVEAIFIIPMIISEISYGLWKLFKGGKNKPAGRGN